MEVKYEEESWGRKLYSLNNWVPNVFVWFFRTKKIIPKTILGHEKIARGFFPSILNKNIIEILLFKINQYVK